jgi:hypothetical protein
VQATVAKPQGQMGNAMAVTETTDTGMFWFFSANNIEVIVKVTVSWIGAKGVPCAFG